ncbi:MAG: SpoIID/LytB domain-containing protein [Aeromicrobium sp.]
MLSWRLTRKILPLAVIVAVLSTVLVVGSDTAADMRSIPSEVAPAPAVLSEHEVPGAKPDAAKPGAGTSAAPTAKPDAVAPRDNNVVAELPDKIVKPFSMVGVTWSSATKSSDLTVQIRWRERYKWSSWTDLELDLENTATEGGRPGTEPQWVGHADGVAVRVTSGSGVKPADVKVATIDPGKSDAITPVAFQTGATDVKTAAIAQAVLAPKPAIILRSAWGASAGGGCDSPIYGQTTRGAVIHHTAGSNTYTASESAGIVRATQSYHVKSRGWCDIGYNFLVDKYGQIFEGRKGGIDKPVRAAHSGNGKVNEETMGVSLMGTFSSVSPTSAMKTAVVQLVSWRFSGYSVPAKGTYSLGGVSLNRIAGHRNVVSTECPGNLAYGWLGASGGLRDRVADTLAASNTVYPVPKNLRSTATAKDSISFAWDAVPDAPKYRIQLSTSSTMSGATYHRFVPASGTITGLKASTTYYAKVRVITTDGVNLSAYSSPAIAVKTASATTASTTSASTTSASATSASAVSESYTVPSSRSIALTGHGYGHGIGMSQYGAQGAARKGLTYSQILSHYYRGTALGTKTGNIRVLLSKDTTDSVMVAGRSGLVFRNLVTNKTMALPTTIGGKSVIRWTINPTAGKKTQSSLQYRTGTTYVTYKSTNWTGAGQFEGPSDMRLILPTGEARFRGALRSALPRTGATNRDTINVLSVENYTRGVVSAEMPSSWMPEALKAQSVAARTYGVRSLTPTRYYDICDTTACQVYGGVAKETQATDSAISATTSKVLIYGGAPAFTQFSSSSGGYTATGSQPYLKAVSDPYDDWSGNSNHDWKTSVAASKIERAYSSIGTLKQLKITKRTGVGDWGGRVDSISLIGSKKTVTISGNTARKAFGLKSNWFKLG